MIFTPYYMDIVSPPQEQPEKLLEAVVDSSLSARSQTTPQPSPQIKSVPSGRVVSHSSAAEEKTLTVESDLYLLEISTINGGSITSFELKDYKQKDSSLVQLINGANNQNLLLSYLSEDGEVVKLSNPWELKSGGSRYIESSPQKLVFQTFVGPNNNLPIEKSLIFYPNRYVIDVAIDFSGGKSHLLNGNIVLSWDGGLTSTEVNKKDDQIYFMGYAYQGGELHDLKVKQGEIQNDELPGKTDWVAIRSKYFVTALIPERPELTIGAGVSGEFNKKELYSTSLVMAGSAPTTTHLYLGPLEFNRIKDLGVELDQLMNFGWGFIKPISKGILWLLKKMYTWIPNYGFVLIVFAFVVKIVVYPLTKKSYQSTQAMQTIQPEVNALKEKYKNNPNKLNQATMQLYKDRGVNPLGGCIPMLIQMPLLFGLFTVFRTTIELRGMPFGGWITDLSAPDTVFYLPFSIPIYGDQVSILPILMVVSMFIQQRMMGGANQQAQQKMMAYFMSGFFFLMFNSFPSGLNLYYTLFNVLTIVQQKFVPAGEVKK